MIEERQVKIEELLKTVTLSKTTQKGSFMGSKIGSKIAGTVAHHEYTATFAKTGIELQYVVVVGDDPIRLQQQIKMLYFTPPPEPP